ncbi:cytochrome b-c1 complex subunit 2, mitochondrial-like isoform X2 [Babylonia areolata]|uniref:cytochrome b-c1 complex subunit 2, mitochondrial-like isoform X2 n=1 Tax=Babylonia areolata TaxID=304850 RepID=UPI003FD4466B
MASVLSRRALRGLQVRLYSATARQEPKDTSVPLRPQPPKLTKLPNGVTVASLENYSPVSRVALVANAGARFEDGDNLGVTHCLRLASGLSTQNLSSFYITRSVEQAGADFTCSSTREYMFYRIDCLRNDLDLVTKVLAETTTAPALKPWELADLGVNMGLDLANLKAQPHVQLFDMLHKAAFRDTLGRSLYAPEFMVGKYTSEQLLHYMKTYFSAGRLALVGVGVDHEHLVAQAKQITPFTSAGAVNNKAKYSGDEIRMEMGGDFTYAAVAVEGPSLAGKDLLYAAVLQNVMGMGPYIKYSSGSTTSRLSQAASKATTHPFAVSCLNANYTDGGLFGFYAIAQAREIEKVLRAAFNQFAAVTKTGLEDKDVERAKNQLKAQISMYREGGDAVLCDLAEQALGSEEILSTADLLSMVDCITSSDVTGVAKKLVNGKPSMAACGNLSRTPYLDSLMQ